MAPPVVVLRGVSARYVASAVSVLTDVSLSIEAGEILVVLGANGAGKSTLLRVLAGTLRPLAGSIELFGVPLFSQARRETAQKVAFVTQTEDVSFAFTVRDVVLMGRAPHQSGVMRPSPEDERLVDSALRDCDLEQVAHRVVTELSGGERKRVAIARAFVQATPLLLLDEPTASLDVPHQVALLDQLGTRAAGGHSSVVVTHDLQLAAVLATRIALLKAGRLLAVGTVEEVLTGQELEAAFDWPIDTGVLTGTRSRVFVPRRSAPPKKPQLTVV